MQWDPKFGWATVATLALFVLGYFVKWAVDVYEERRRTRRFYIALLAELKLNVDALDEDLKNLPSSAVINSFLAKNIQNRPHIMSIYITDIYKSNLILLPALPDVIIRNLISFYSEIEFIDVLVKSFEQKSFETISLAGREQCYLRLKAEMEAAANRGRPLLDQIKLTLRIPDHA